MEWCPNCIIGEYKAYCTCKLTNNICVFTRRCSREMQWLPLDSMQKCKLRSDIVKGNIRFIKNGYLFVDVDDRTVKIKNPYDYEPTNVNIVKINGEYYIKGYEPKNNKKDDDVKR